MEHDDVLNYTRLGTYYSDLRVLRSLFAEADRLERHNLSLVMGIEKFVKVCRREMKQLSF
jgi:hypothetical protein